MNRTTHTQERASLSATNRRKATVTMRQAVAPHLERMERMRKQREADKSVNWQTVNINTPTEGE